MTKTKNIDDNCDRKELDHALVTQAQNGDAAARAELVARHINLVHSLASRLHRRDHTHEDLVQEGVCGLLLAIDRFDTRNDVQFATYAIHYIRSSITGAITRTLPKDRSTKKVYSKGPYVYKQFWQKGEFNPSYEDVAHQLGVDPSYVASVYSSLMPAVVMEYEDIHFADTAESPEDKLIREDEERQVRREISKLPQKEYEIINRRFKEDRDTLQHTGDHLGVTRERVRQVENIAFRRLKRSMLRSGVGKS